MGFIVGSHNYSLTGNWMVLCSRVLVPYNIICYIGMFLKTTSFRSRNDQPATTTYAEFQFDVHLFLLWPTSIQHRVVVATGVIKQLLIPVVAQPNCCPCYPLRHVHKEARVPCSLLPLTDRTRRVKRNSHVRCPWRNRACGKCNLDNRPPLQAVATVVVDVLGKPAQEVQRCIRW